MHMHDKRNTGVWVAVAFMAPVVLAAIYFACYLARDKHQQSTGALRVRCYATQAEAQFFHPAAQVEAWWVGYEVRTSVYWNGPPMP